MEGSIHWYMCGRSCIPAMWTQLLHGLKIETHTLTSLALKPNMAQSLEKKWIHVNTPLKAKLIFLYGRLFMTIIYNSNAYEEKATTWTCSL